MMLLLLFVSALLLSVAYRVYGAFLERRCRVDPARETPACAVNDGVDYVPTRASVLFGHHFSSIAGAGPIVGPIIAASLFGWLPTWIWIILGSIFVGGVHDFGSTLMSLRSGGDPRNGKLSCPGASRGGGGTRFDTWERIVAFSQRFGRRFGVRKAPGRP